MEERRYPPMAKQAALWLAHTAWVCACLALAGWLAAPGIRILPVFVVLCAPGTFVAYRYRQRLLREAGWKV